MPWNVSLFEECSEVCVHILGDYHVLSENYRSNRFQQDIMELFAVAGHVNI